MNRKTDKKGNAVSVLFTMLLFLVFVLCALFTVLIGSRVYENIIVRRDANYTGKVRQGDRAGMVNVVDVDGTQVLEMKQEIGESEYVTWIYWDNGSIRELFTDTSSGLGLGDGLEILECQGLKLLRDGRLPHIETVGEGGGRLEISLRSGGLETDE